MEGHLLILKPSAVRRGNMVKIELTQNKIALINDADEEEIRKFKWRANFTKDKVYAVRERKKDEWPSGVKVGETVSMHRFLLGIHLFNGRSVIGDHRDGKGLNNQRSNLRACSLQENGQNKRAWNRSKSSRYKGVVKMKNRPGQWQAYLKTGGRKLHIGTFNSELDAAKSYDVFAVKHFGDYANLNFKPGGVPF